MNNRRQLKKQINNSMELLLADCILYKTFVVNANAKEADKIILEIFEKRLDLLSKVSVNEGKNIKGKVKSYFKKLNLEVIEVCDSIGKKIMSLE